jgi:hypothetical protein
MKAVLKSISSDDYDLSNYRPEDEMIFSLNIVIRIGAEGSGGADNFHLFVCTPEWLCKHCWEPYLIRHMLLVRKYDFGEIKKAISEYIEQCDGDEWIEVAQKLSRIFDWEFEDYSK